MALAKYGAAQVSLTINGINIETFGDTDPAVTISSEADWSTQKDGIGGVALRLDRINLPKTMTVNLLPGCDEVTQLLALQKTGEDFYATFRQIGTNESTVMYEGIMTQLGDRGRAGRGSVTDEVFNFRFNDSEDT